MITWGIQSVIIGVSSPKSLELPVSNWLVHMGLLLSTNEKIFLSNENGVSRNSLRKKTECIHKYQASESEM